MAQFAPYVRGGMNLAKAAKFAGSPTVSGGMSLAQAAVPYLTDSQTAQNVVGGLATGQKVYGALSGGMSQPVSIAGTSLGATGGQVSGAIGLMSTMYNASQGMTDPEAIGLQALGSVLMMSGNPYLMAAGAVMQFVGPMLQGTPNSKISLSGKGSTKWGDDGLAVPDVYHGGVVSNQAKQKDGNLGGYLSAIENMPKEQMGAGDAMNYGNPSWQQLGLKSADQMTPEWFDSEIARKEALISEYQAKAKEQQNAGPYSAQMPGTPDYTQMAWQEQQALKDLMGTRDKFSALSPYGVDTPSGKAYTGIDIASSGLPYVANSNMGDLSIDEGIASGVKDVTGIAFNKFNSEVKSILDMMPEDQRSKVMDKLQGLDFEIDYGGAWKTKGNDPKDVMKRLPDQFVNLGNSVYDQLWSTVEDEFGVNRADLLSLIPQEEIPTGQAANIASSIAAPALMGKTTAGGTLAGKTFGTQGVM